MMVVTDDGGIGEVEEGRMDVVALMGTGVVLRLPLELAADGGRGVMDPGPRADCGRGVMLRADDEPERLLRAD